MAKSPEKTKWNLQQLKGKHRYKGTLCTESKSMSTEAKVLEPQTDNLTPRPGVLYLRSVMFLRGTSFSSLSEAAFPAKQ